MNEVKIKKRYNEIYKRFIKCCDDRNIPYEKHFIDYYLQLLICDIRLGFDIAHKDLTDCKMSTFLKNTFEMYINPLDATLCLMKLAYYYRNNMDKKLEYVITKYGKLFQKKFHTLREDILRYPENCNRDQINQMFRKIQIFIISIYNIGDPKNHVLQNLTKQSLNSVLGPRDLNNYVLMKRNQRLEYLDRLSSTVCGIIIHNNSGPSGDKENVRDIIGDLEMAKKNTTNNLDTRIKEVNELVTRGTDLLESIIIINIEKEMVISGQPIERLRRVNNFIVLFTWYEDVLLDLKKEFAHTCNLVDDDGKKFKCIIEKINHVLSGRNAIETELVFPHFIYASEVWKSLVNYFNHIVEINKIKEYADVIVNADIEKKYLKEIDDIKKRMLTAKYPRELKFDDILQEADSKYIEKPLPNISNLREYCSLTIAFTDGLLCRSKINRKLCPDVDLTFGFRSLDYSKKAQHGLLPFIRTLRNVIFKSIDLIILFNLEKQFLEFFEEILKEEIIDTTHSIETQTEMVVTNDLSVPNRINVTWNAWDFYRETIRLADLRKKQTNSTQTLLSYGQRTAQNQTYLQKDNQH